MSRIDEGEKAWATLILEWTTMDIRTIHGADTAFKRPKGPNHQWAVETYLKSKMFLIVFILWNLQVQIMYWEFYYLEFIQNTGLP